jgi:predicted amidohydrolase YtcJ
MAWWGHGLLLNAAARKWAGVSDAMPDPLGGWLDRDAQGRFTGRLDEYAGAAMWRRLSTLMPRAAHTEAFRRYAAGRLEQGVTSLQLMTTSQAPDGLALSVSAAKSPLKVRLVHFVIPAEDGVKPLKVRTISPSVRLDGIKYVIDGTPIDQFAYRSTEYAGRPGWRGRLNFSPEFIRDRLKEALNSDQQLLLHVVGDASATLVLDMMEEMAPAAQWRPRRVRLEHGNGVTGPNIARASSLGVVVAQGRPTSPYKSWRDGSLRVAYGSDTAFGPWMMLKAMTAAGNPHAVSREDALDTMTFGPAWAEFQETEKGRLAPGLRADLAVLSQDVLTCPADHLDKTESLLTLIDGKIAHAVGHV